MFNRWIEAELLDVLEREGVGCIAFSPLAQGLLTDKYLDGIPEDSRVRRGQLLSEDLITPENLERVRALNEIAAGRGQTLAQMAIAWALRDPRVTSALIGASSVPQLEQNVAALENLDFDDDELAEIDRYAVDGSDQHLGLLLRGLDARWPPADWPLIALRAMGPCARARRHCALTICPLLLT